jgi:hypothetical protein
MKKLIITSITVLALAASCIEDSRNNFMVDDTSRSVRPVLELSTRAQGLSGWVIYAGSTPFTLEESK